MREMEDFSQSEFDEIYNGLKCCAIKEAYAVDFPKAIILTVLMTVFFIQRAWTVL